MHIQEQIFSTIDEDLTRWENQKTELTSLRDTENFNELFMRRLLDENPSKDIALDYYTFKYGEATCYSVLVSFVILYFFIGWGTLYYKSRNI